MPDFLGTLWACVLLAFAQNAVVPLGFSVLSDEIEAKHIGAFFCIRCCTSLAAFASLIALFSAPGTLPLILTLPWLALAFFLFLLGLLLLRDGGWGPPWRWCRLICFLYMPIGALWFSCHRAGFYPLEFHPTIVLLTAVHFHYVGFAVPLVASLILHEMPLPAAKWISLSVIVSPLLVAAGITGTQLGLGQALERLAAVFMSSVGLLIAVLQVRLALRAQYNLLSRAYWAVSSGCLFLGMLFAFSYALRGSFFSIPGFPALSIPMMIAVHGSLNAIGFSFFSLLGWKVRSVEIEQFL